MATKSSIEWTEETWNPVVGCSKVSAGCKFCYAEVMARRLQAMRMADYADGFEVRLLPHRLGQPLLKKQPTTYFVNSMSDLFHEAVPDEYIDRVFSTIASTPRHTYQILTKRAERLPDYFRDRVAPDNAWIGVSVENRSHGVLRIQHLQQVQARTRFLSVEPLLEDLGELDLAGIAWVIVGGESGSGARPMKQDWVLRVQEQCARFGAAFFFKQWGAHGPDGIRRNKKANGRLLSGQTWNALPSR